MGLFDWLGGNKNSTSTSTVTIPPEYMEEYRNVMNIANLLREQEFQPYTGEFVAPLTQTQQAGIANINQAAGMAQPYFQGATQSLLGGASEAQPFYSSAAQNVLNAQTAAQPYQGAATQYTTGAGAAAQPLQQQSLNALAAGQAASQPLLQGSITGMQQAISGAQPFQRSAADVGLSGVASAMGTQQDVLAGLGAAQRAASPYYGATQQSMTGATLANQPFANLAAAGYAGAQGTAAPLQQSAAGNLYGAQYGAQPLQRQAARDVTAAQMGAQPYQQTATELGLAGARGISPEQLAIQQYMSPYLESVVGSTMKNLRQQQQQEQSQLLGNQIAAGAFGGDRGRIAQANLARQQEMATGQTVANLMNQGYGQALSTAQQQQGVSLGAEQANRAAQAQAAQQMAALGQQGFGQGLAAAQQRAALAQQSFGQDITTAQQQAALAQQLYGQQMGVAQAQQGLGQQGFAQNMAQAQQNQALAQQMYSQGANTAQIQAALAQQQAAQGVQLGQLQAGLGAQAFGQGAQMAQQQANVGQALFGQGATTAQQQAALAQQAYAQQMGMGQQMAAIGQQGFGQGLAAAQAQQGIGQGLYGMGAGVSQGLAGLGTGAQAAALQGGQAQLGAGQVEQQTQQALNQALYNQFLQQQGYPFQTTQFLGNLAMGTGSLAGSTTTTTQPSSFWSDKRLKDDIEPIGKTYDGQDIVRYRYKGEPATQIGLLAQDVEKKHPEAVGEAAGYKTVNYHDATDEAAARAPHKAYGGGLAPASMGGGVFREDAGQGFAVGGAPGGDDILAQINALVNSHQGMFPYGKAGMYGTGLGKAGPYGSTIMPAPNRSLMRAEHVGPRMENISAMEGLGRAAQTGSNIEKMYGAGKGAVSIADRALYGSPGQVNASGNQLQGTTGAIGAGGTSSGQGYVDRFWAALRRAQEPEVPQTNYSSGAVTTETLPEIPSGNARGGAIRPGLASGGMPYSDAENEYVDEDLTKPFKSQTLQPAAASKPGQSSGIGGVLGGLGNVASLYKMGEKGLPFLEKGISGLGGLFSGAGGAAEGAAALGAAEGAAGGAAAAGGLESLLALFALSDKRAKENIEPIGELFDGQKVYRYNYKEKGLAPRKNYRDGGGDVPEEWRQHIADASQRFSVPEHILRAVAMQESGLGRNAPENPFQIIESTARDPGFGVPPIALEDRGRPEAFIPWAANYIAARNPNTDWNDSPTAARALARNWNAGGDPNYGYNVGRYLPNMTPDQLAALRVNSEAPQGTGLAPPTPPRQPYTSREDVQSPYMRQALQVLQQASKREEPDWMQRNQDWLVPLLSGLGTMASSPSRYLGSSILQGLAGGAQSYAGIQKTLEEQRAAREGREQAAVGRMTEAGRLDVERLREETAARNAALQQYEIWRRAYRVGTGPDGRTPGFYDAASRFLTNAEFAAEEARVRGQLGLDVGPSSGPVSSGTQGGVGANAPAGTATPPVPAVSPAVAPDATQAAPPAPAAAQPTAPAQTPATRSFADVAGAEYAKLLEEMQKADAARRSLPQDTPAYVAQTEILERARRRMDQIVDSPRDMGGVRVRLVENAPPIVPQPAPPISSQPKAEIDPRTGRINTVIPNIGNPQTGGFVPNPAIIGVPHIRVESDPLSDAQRADSAKNENEYSNRAEQSQTRIQTLLRFATAAKMLEFGGATTQIAEWANLARGLGLDSAADVLMTRGATEAALTGAKTSVVQAMEGLRDTFPRATQSEFGISLNRASPTPDQPPGTARSILQHDLALELRYDAFKNDWAEARQQGVTNFNTWRQSWEQLNPATKFIEQANGLLGNFKGQELPTSGQMREGVVYVAPISGNYPLKDYLNRQGIGAGEPFVVTIDDNGTRHARRVSPAGQAPDFNSLYMTYMQAPGFSSGRRQ